MTIKPSFEQAVEETEKRLGLGPTAQQQQKYWDKFKGLPFWIEDKQKHENKYDYWLGKSYTDAKGAKPCCFWHAINLPQKNGEPKPLFDYEQEIYDALKESPYLWIKKATSLGITEFFLRLIAWLCLVDNEWRGGQVCVVVGPRIDLAITLIDRIKGLFPDITFDTAQDTVILNDCTIRAYPSHHLDSMRSLVDVKFIFIDEGDFFPPGEQQDARAVSERYIAKSDPYIVMVSTPNQPEGLFEGIEREAEDICIYKRLFFDYTRGLDRIYTKEEIAQARESPSFEREYNLKYIGLQGNVFSSRSIEVATQKGEQLEAIRKSAIPYDMPKSMGVDAGFGSSKFGIVVTGLNRWGIIECLFAEEYDRPDFNQMIDEIMAVRRNFNVQKIFIDDMNPEVVSALKAAYGEDPDYRTVMSKHKLGNVWMQWMNVIPVSFRSEHKGMLAHLKRFLDAESFAVSPSKFNKLIVALRTAVSTESNLNKELTAHDDLIDSLRLSMKHWVIQTEKEVIA